MRRPSTHALALWGAIALVALAGVTWWRVSALSERIQADTHRFLSTLDEGTVKATFTHEGVTYEVVTPQVNPITNTPEDSATWAARHLADIAALKAALGITEPK